MVPLDLSLAQTATSGLGPSNIGANYTPSFFSSFAVGSGASATATSAPVSDSPGATGGTGISSQTILLAAALIGAAILALGILFSRK